MYISIGFENMRHSCSRKRNRKQVEKVRWLFCTDHTPSVERAPWDTVLRFLSEALSWLLYYMYISIGFENMRHSCSRKFYRKQYEIPPLHILPILYICRHKSSLGRSWQFWARLSVACYIICIYQLDLRIWVSAASYKWAGTGPNSSDSHFPLFIYMPL
jgi:hypothetical protein